MNNPRGDARKHLPDSVRIQLLESDLDEMEADLASGLAGVKDEIHAARMETHNWHEEEADRWRRITNYVVTLLVTILGAVAAAGIGAWINAG